MYYSALTAGVVAEHSWIYRYIRGATTGPHIVGAITVHSGITSPPPYKHSSVISIAFLLRY